MKYTLHLITLFALSTSALGGPQQIEIEARYKGFDRAWFADISRPEDAKAEGEVFSAPRVTTKSGQNAVIEIIKEVPVRVARGRRENINCGVSLEVTPVCEGRKIVLTGKSTIRRSVSPKRAQPLGAATFVVRETYFNGTLENGKPTTIKVGDTRTGKEEVTFTAKLINPDGTSTKR